MMEVVQKEIQKLLDANVIYPISDSQWVSPVHVVPKKTGITVEKNADSEMVTTRVKNGWRMCIDYRKLNAIDFQATPIAPEDQEKTTFTCPFGTFAFRRRSFGLCNASGTFQRVVTSIFLDMIGTFIEVFMDDFTVYGDTFDACLDNLSHVVSHEGIKVDKAKIDLIVTLPYPSTVRYIKSFLGHTGHTVLRLRA
ncbi:unnamed protein product [Rhodiola kirilowii]